MEDNKMNGELKILTGRSHVELAQRVARLLNVKLVKIDTGSFNNGELKNRVKENVRGSDLFFLQSLHCKYNFSTIEEMEFIVDCVKDSAKRISGIFPWIAYAKQDRKTKPRESRSFKVVARRISQSGLDRILLFDIHNSATECFFDIPVDRVYLMKLLIENFQAREIQNFAIGSPDEGSVKRASFISDLLNLNSDICVVTKYRDPKTKKIDIEKSRVLGDVQGKIVFFFDDMIQGFNTLKTASQIVKKAGAKKIIAAAVHPDFTQKTMSRINQAPIDEIIVVDTIPIEKKSLSKKVTILDPAPYIAECITRLHMDMPLSPLFIDH